MLTEETENKFDYGELRTIFGLEGTQLVFLQNIERALRCSKTCKQAFQGTFDIICREMDWFVAHVYFVETSSDGEPLLVPSDVWFLSHPTDCKAFYERTKETTFASGEGLPGRVLESRRPLWVENLETDKNFPRNKLGDDLPVHTGFGVPVFTQNNVFAVMEFFSTKAISEEPLQKNALVFISDRLGNFVERKTREDEMTESSNYLGAIVDSVSDAIVTIDEQGTIKSVNRSFEFMFKYQSREVIGKNVSMIMPEPHRSAHDSYIKNYRDTKSSKVIGRGSRELTGLRKDGSEFSLELTIEHLRLVGKDSFVGVLREVTGSKAAIA